MNYIQQLGQNAARAKKQIAGCPTGEKNRILTEIAAILRANASEILKANEPVSYTHLTLPTIA